MTHTHHDSVAIIQREVEDLLSTDPAVRRSALATIRQEVHTMDRLEGEHDGAPRMSDVCAKLTHHNGQLIARYRTTR